MTHLKAQVTFTCNDKNLKPEEQAMALENLQQQALYSDEEYDEATYWKWISIFDTGMWVEDAEERNNTSLDPLYLEEWIDVELLCRVRQLHKWIKVPTETELDNYDKLDDCLSINHSWRDKRKFVIMNTPGYETKYHMLPGGWMVASLVKSSSPYTRKVIRNEEGNFEEIIDNDKPDWVLEMERNEERINKVKKMEHKTKILWKAIKDSRNEYKPLYDAMDKLKSYPTVKDKDNRINKLRDKASKSYAEFKYYSRAMDKVKELDAKAEHQHLQREADMLLHLFVEFQQKCPDEYVDSVTREDIKNKYKNDWYERTRYYLKRLINRAEDLVQTKSYEEEEETA